MSNDKKNEKIFFYVFFNFFNFSETVRKKKWVKIMFPEKYIRSLKSEYGYAMDVDVNNNISFDLLNQTAR